MKKIKIDILITLMALFSGVFASSQTLPLGTSIEDYARRQQLLGNFDSTYSFSIRPLRFDTIQQNVLGFQTSSPVAILDNRIAKVSVLPAEQVFQFNSHHPKAINNGSMVPGRGLQSITRPGLNIKVGPLNAYIKPEIYYSANRSYEGFPDTLSNNTWNIRYRWWNKTDLPEEFGIDPISRILPGQSKISLDLGKFSLGVSSENLWWGPGKRHALIMTNNPRGFNHISFNSLGPVNTKIGGLEWQVIAGRLEESGFDPPYPDRFDINRYFVVKNDDWRYLSAFSLVYSPKWFNGLSLGFNRAIQQYSSLAKSNKDFVPIIQNFFRNNDRTDRPQLQIDQVLSGFFRYYSSKSNAEFYFEYGRNDASLNIRDFIMSPEHSRAFVLGASKLFPGPKDGFIELNLEMTHTQQSIGNLVRPTESWYTHTMVSHGYTNNGEVIGAGIGPGSNVQNLEVNWTKGIKKFGVQFERLVHNNDFFLEAYSPSKDWRRYWVDLSPGINCSWDFNGLLIQSNLFVTRSLNYQWELQNNPGNQPYFVEGRDVTNLHFTTHLVYFFDNLLK